MIIRVADLTWLASNKMTVNMIPQFVESVAKLGGKYLIYQDEFINVQSALQNKESADNCICMAHNYYMEYLVATNKSDETSFRRKMINELIRAGAYSRLYIRDINIRYFGSIVLVTPSFFKTHPKFKKFWDQGFSDMMNNLYEECN